MMLYWIKRVISKTGIVELTLPDKLGDYTVKLSKGGQEAVAIFSFEGDKFRPCFPLGFQLK